MVPAVATAVETLPNTFTFSECTIKQIRDHISSSVTKTECLRHSPMDQVGYSGLGETQQPGQIFDVEQQCQQTFGSEYKFCGTNDYYLKQMCRQIWCRNATQGPKSPCVSKPYLPPLSGTTCGHKMWCINGACVEDEKAPSQEGCKFGDRDTSFCLKLVLTEPSKCKTDMFNRFCCESCRQFKRKLYRRLRL
uniref:ADAM cysteine-rich domain-containing protein n=1 Tax=Romanomermis culicivorax TaxID=13658 RepID=A0A915IGI6_ROMCU